MALMALNVIAIQPFTEARPTLEAAQMTYNVVTAATVFAAGIAGLVALIRSRDWSLAVILPVTVMIVALALMSADLIAS